MVDAWEAHEGGVRASSMIRDDDSPGDFLNVLLDTFGDRQNAVTFSTTPGGQRNDWTISNDAQDDAALSPAWNGVWDLAVRRGADGWHAEYRIPFTTLRFTTRNGRAELGLSINRLTAHSNERVTFPAIEPSAPLALWKPSRWQRVSIEDISTARSFRVTPYVMAGSEGTRAPDPVLSPWHRDERVEAGGDLKTALSPNLTLDLTVNTDFAEAEVDDQRVNLTRFPLFYPERRAFFVERAGTFEVKTGEVDMLFNSRRVGLTPDGEPVRLLGGARLVGQVGGWDVGLFDVQTGQTPSGVRENLGVRARAAGAAQPALLGRHHAHLAGEPGLGPGRARRRRRAAPRRRRLRRLRARGAGRRRRRRPGRRRAAARRAAAPGGAAPQPGDVVSHRRRHHRRPLHARARLRRAGGRHPAPGGDRLRLGGLAGGAPAARQPVVVLRLPQRGGDIRWIHRVRGPGVRAARRRGLDPHPDPPGGRPAGAVRARCRRRRCRRGGTRRASSSWSSSPRPARARWSAAPCGRASTTTAGSTRCCSRPSGAPRPTCGSPPTCSSIASSFRRAASGSGRRLARLRVLASATPRLSLSAVLQANGVADLATANLRLRYNVREGHDLWVVYNHDQNLDRDRAEPRMPATARSGLLVKYTRSFGR